MKNAYQIVDALFEAGASLPTISKESGFELKKVIQLLRAEYGNDTEGRFLLEEEVRNNHPEHA